MNSPHNKILILSYLFSRGDAVTGLNIFSSWDKSKLFCASSDIDVDINNFASFYLLGNSELKVKWPFSHFIKKKESGVLESLPPKTNSTYLRKSVNSYLLDSLRFLYPYGFRRKARLSRRFYEWIETIKPDYIYTSVSDYAFAKLILLLMDKHPEIKFVVHLYDDWTLPSYKILYGGLFHKLCENRLKQIVKRAYRCLAISDYMAIDYTKRYGKTFTWLPNPIQLPDLQVGSKNSNSIVFMGKIIMHNYEAILNMIKAVDRLNRNSNKNITFQVYSTYNYFDADDLAKKYPWCHFYSWVAHEEVMNILQNASILYLPITANKETQKFTKYSMSTKIPEYMSSGTPILYCGPKDIAMTHLLETTKTAHVIGDSSVDQIEAAITHMLENREETERMSQNARDFVCMYMTNDIVDKQLLSIFD